MKRTGSACECCATIGACVCRDAVIRSVGALDESNELSLRLWFTFLGDHLFKKLSFRALFRGGVVAGLGFAAVLLAHDVKAADHIDSPTLAPTPLADINDVYAWMTPDANTVNLVMTLSPADNGLRKFGPGVQYVFHVTSKSGLGVGQTDGTETKILCTFTSNTAAKCWIGTSTVKDYVEGDPSQIGGAKSDDRKVTLFAGRRSDPFFFNLQGFRDAITLVKSLAATLTFDAAGCPNNLTDPQVASVRAKLQQGAVSTATAPCATDHADCFKHLRVQAIVLQVDKSLLLDPTHNVVAVWGSTHMGS